MKLLSTILLMAVAAIPLRVAAGEAQASLLVDGQPFVTYQAKPLAKPDGGHKFNGSNFIHPLKTPSGFTVTDIQPEDHLHHFGLWWPWKYIKTGNRKVLFWELQRGDGIIQAVEHTAVDNGLVTQSVYLDRKAPGGPVALLHETTNIRFSSVVDHPARGYFLDLEIHHRAAGDQSLVVTPYRYSGFAFRGTAAWNRTSSTILTSKGHTRNNANFTHARWVRVEGVSTPGQTAGVLLMSRPDNRAHPEKLRTWDEQHEGAIFINFNTVGDEAWHFEPGMDYTRHYRLFIYDGNISDTQAGELWQEYAKTTK